MKNSKHKTSSFIKNEANEIIVCMLIALSLIIGLSSFNSSHLGIGKASSLLTENLTEDFDKGHGNEQDGDICDPDNPGNSPNCREDETPEEPEDNNTINETDSSADNTPPSDGDNQPTDDTTNPDKTSPPKDSSISQKKPPAQITDLTLLSKNTTWLYWKWINPLDKDFSQAIIYLNNINQLNTSDNFYNATGLEPNTSYTITIYTKNKKEEVNWQVISGTETTSSLPCIESWTEQYTECIPSDKKTKFYTDANSCGTISSLPADNGTAVFCDYCTPSLTNKSWSDWNNQTECINNSLTQNRSLVEYDENSCNEIPNQTYWEFQIINCTIESIPGNSSENNSSNNSSGNNSNPSPPADNSASSGGGGGGGGGSRRAAATTAASAPQAQAPSSQPTQAAPEAAAQGNAPSSESAGSEGMEATGAAVMGQITGQSIKTDSGFGGWLFKWAKGFADEIKFLISFFLILLIIFCIIFLKESHDLAVKKANDKKDRMALKKELMLKKMKKVFERTEVFENEKR